MGSPMAPLDVILMTLKGQSQGHYFEDLYHVGTQLSHKLQLKCYH